MQASQIPTKFTMPWGANAGTSYIRQIPASSQIGIQAGAASLADGFPPLTFIDITAGGAFPFGQDHNGILNQITAWSQWQNAGAQVPYDSAFSTAIGGYPKGALLYAAAGGAWWLSLVDNNASNPDTGGANWQIIGYGNVYAGNPNGHVAGTAPSSGFFVQSLLWDTTDNILWLCTVTGTTATAVWTVLIGLGAEQNWYGTSTGSANAQVLSVPGSIQSFNAGTTELFIAGYTNTGAATLQFGTLGTYALRKDGPTGPTALTGGEIIAGNVVSGIFDGTYIHLVNTALASIAVNGSVNPTANLPMATFRHTGVGNAVAATDYAAAGQVQSGSLVVATATGTGDAITLAFTPTMTAFSSGPCWWRATAANTTTTPTVKRDGLAANTLVKGNNLALVVGDIAGAGMWVCSQYDSTLGVEVMQNPATGLNYGITPAQFSNNTLLATTAFVKSAGKYFGGCIESPPTTLTTAHAGQLLLLSIATYTLPAANTFQAGACISFLSNSSPAGASRLSTAGSDVIHPWLNSNVPLLDMKYGTTLTLVSNGNNAWMVADGNATQGSYSGDFLNTFGANGYQYLPSGFEFKWGYVASVPIAAFTVTYPTAFPNTTVYANFILSANNNVGNTNNIIPGMTAGGFNGINGNGVAAACWWFAIGY